jgi:hypothetical protein
MEPTGYPELDQIARRLDGVRTLDARGLEAEEIAILGRKAGALTALLKRVAELPIEERKRYGALVNRLKGQFEAAFAERREVVAAERRPQEDAGRDLTMPGRGRWVGAEHPVSRVVDEIVEIFRGIGFTVAVGPEVETDWYNFLALNFPADHPAMDMHDTLYLDAPAVEGEPSGRLLLRTHTSPVQIRTLLESPPPVRVVIPGMVYRNDAFDASHSPGLQPDRGPRRGRRDLVRGPQGHADPLRPPVLLAQHAHPVPALVLPLHRAVGGDGRGVPDLPRERLPGVQGHRVDGDPGLRDGASQRAEEREPRSGALHRLGLRHGAAPDRDAALRPAGHPPAAGGGHAVPGADGSGDAGAQGRREGK